MADGQKLTIVIGGRLHGGVDGAGDDVAAEQVFDVVENQVKAIEWQTAKIFG